MSRTLNDDFEDDETGLPLEVETGSQVGTGGPSSYDGGGLELDDELEEDGANAAALELDLPAGSAAALRSASAAAQRPPPAPEAPSAQPRPAATGPGTALVPDLALAPARPAPPPPARPDLRAPEPAPGLEAAAPVPPPALHAPPPAPAHGAGPAPEEAPPSSHGPASERGGSGTAAGCPARPDAAAVIAKYPPPPGPIWQTPKYALLVLLRQFELRNELVSLRRRRSPDVPLYEAALRAQDARSFRLGLTILGAAFALVTLLCVVRVILS